MHLMGQMTSRVTERNCSKTDHWILDRDLRASIAKRHVFRSGGAKARYKAEGQGIRISANWPPRPVGRFAQLIWSGQSNELSSNQLPRPRELMNWRAGGVAQARKELV